MYGYICKIYVKYFTYMPMRSLTVLLFVGAVAMLSLYPRGGHLDHTRGLVNGGVTMAQYEHGVLRVIDGDTLVISATYLPPPLRPELLLRICGIDTPERGWRADCEYERAQADRATAFVQDLLTANNGVTNTIIRKWDKYGGRVLGDLYFAATDSLLSEILVNHSLALPYAGGRHPPNNPWCTTILD